MIKGFLFDLDETIWSSEKAIINALSQTINEKNDIHLGEGRIKNLLRNNFTFNDVLKKYEVYSLSPYWRNFRKTLNDIKLFFPETINVFDILKNKDKKIGFVTSLKREFSVTLLERFGLFNFADTIITPSECRVPKPNPKSIKMAIKELGLDPNEVIYIGDTENDMKAAKNAGCLSGLAKWGNYQQISIKLDHVFNHLEDILKLT
tara:strand:+ start:1898 stop:2512 length:615 start_codon:yes stop_codon:yes gene_type:complete